MCNRLAVNREEKPACGRPVRYMNVLVHGYSKSISFVCPKRGYESNEESRPLFFFSHPKCLIAMMTHTQIICAVGAPINRVLCAIEKEDSFPRISSVLTKFETFLNSPLPNNRRSNVGELFCAARIPLVFRKRFSKVIELSNNKFYLMSAKELNDRRASVCVVCFFSPWIKCL